MARSGSPVAPNRLGEEFTPPGLSRRHLPPAVKLPHAPAHGEAARPWGTLLISGNSQPGRHRTRPGQSVSALVNDSLGQAHCHSHPPGTIRGARPATAPNPYPTESAAPHPRRRPDTGQVFLDRAPGQGWPQATAKRRAKPVLDAVRDRETIEPRVGGEHRNEATAPPARRTETKPRPTKPDPRHQKQAVSSKHDRVARLDAPSP